MIVVLRSDIPDILRTELIIISKIEMPVNEVRTSYIM